MIPRFVLNMFIVVPGVVLEFSLVKTYIFCNKFKMLGVNDFCNCHNFPTENPCAR